MDRDPKPSCPEYDRGWAEGRAAVVKWMRKQARQKHVGDLERQYLTAFAGLIEQDYDLRAG